MNNTKTCKEFVEQELTITEKARRIFSVKCMTVKEKHDYLLTKIEEYFQKHGRIPFVKYKIPESGFCLGKWLSQVRCGITKLTDPQNKRLLDLDPNFFIIKKKKQIGIDRIVQELIKFYKEKGRMPYQGETVALEDLGEIKLGQSWNTIKQNGNKRFTDQHRQLILKVFPNAFNYYQEVVDKFFEFYDDNGSWPLQKNDKIQMHGKEYSIGKSFYTIQKNPDKFLTKDLIIKLEEKDPLWRLNLMERIIIKKLDKCFEFYKKYQHWPKFCQENKNYPLDVNSGETFDIGQFWNNIKFGTTTISENYYKKILELDRTFTLGKKRKRGD